MKKALSIILAAVMMLAVLPMGAAAAEVETKDIEPRIYDTVYVSLTTDWTEVTHDDNMFQEYVKVINHAENKGSIEVMFVKSDNTTVAAAKTIAPGSQEVFGPIPSNIGRYTVKARVLDVSQSDTYAITVSDYV